MTVQDLINKLLDYPSNTRVLTLGYEGGFDDIGLSTENVVFDVNSKDQWYYGRHEKAKYVDGADGTDCVIIGRV